jgi:hypothetical protein
MKENEMDGACNTQVISIDTTIYLEGKEQLMQTNGWRDNIRMDLRVISY